MAISRVSATKFADSDAPEYHDMVDWQTLAMTKLASCCDLLDGQRIEGYDPCTNFTKCTTHSGGGKMHETGYRIKLSPLHGAKRLTTDLFGLASLLGSL